MSFTDGLAFFARKLWWWMAHHPAALVAHGGALRKVRLFEWLALAMCTFHMLWVWRRHGWVVLSHRIPPSGCQRTLASAHQATAMGQCMVWLLLFGLGGLMLAQLLPILYNSRYSSTLLDPWLVLLTGFSVAYLLQPYQFSTGWHRSRWSMALTGRKMAGSERARLWPGVFVVPGLLVITVLAFNTVRRYEVVAIDTTHMGAHRTRIALPANTSLLANGMAKQSNGLWLMTESPAALVLPVSAEQVALLKQHPPYNALWEINMAIRTDRPRRCRMAEVAYTRPVAGPARPISRLNLDADGQPRLYAIHGNVDLRPSDAGDLRVAFHCPVGTLVQWNGARLLESLHTENAPPQPQARH